MSSIELVNPKLLFLYKIYDYGSKNGLEQLNQKGSLFFKKQSTLNLVCYKLLASEQANCQQLCSNH